MSEKSKSGCFAGALILVVGGLLVCGGLVFFFFASKRSELSSRSHAEALASERSHGRFHDEQDSSGKVIIHGVRFPALPFPSAGDELTREQFLSFVTADNATKLAREEFRRVASQATIRWLLRTSDIFEEGGSLSGHFELPWELRSANGASGSSVQIRCEFLPEARPLLLKLRQGDWVTIEGQITFNQSQATIKNARIANGTPRAEQY